MILYPNNIENKIGFDTVRELLKEECLSSLGTAFVDKMKFSTSFDLVEKLNRQTEEFRQILSAQEPFPATGFLDISQQLAKARIEGAFLTEEEFHDLKQALQTIFSARHFFEEEERADNYPLLADLCGMVDLDKSLLTNIEQKIDEKGKLRNNASRELMDIRQRLIREQQRLRKVLDQLLRSAQGKGYTPDDVSLTIRGGRMVIPVLAEHKRKLKGFIHDESATGQTVFMEPAEVLDINNEIRDLEYQEKREIIRILTALTDQLRPNLEALKSATRFLGMLDFIRAKAKFALKIGGVMPAMQKKQMIDWKDARHPLLYLSHQQQGKPVIPLSIQLNHQQRIILISGPNAGGKSVSLKTVALLQYMLQCGLLIPVEEGSTAGMFNSIFIDIGDEQSIENDLSTYSSHLSNMRYFYEYADKRSLFLIDEFGTGTEPQFGGAIAQAMLEELNTKRAFGVITTHYGNLKQYADKTPGIVNAAMRFDLEKLESTYVLEIGKAGSSYALEIARKMGLHEKILQNARSNVGFEQVKYDKLLGQLEKEKTKFRKLNRDAERKDEELKSAVKEYTELKEFLENEKKKVLNEAKAEAKQLLKEANRKIESTIREIKEQKAEKELTKKKRAELESMDDRLKMEKVAGSSKVKVEKGPVEIGDLVRIKGQDTVGEVVSFKGKDVEIMIGQLKSNVKLNRLEKISKKAFKKISKEGESPKAMQGIDLNRTRADFSPNLDVRGKRAEEAITEVDAHLDKALMFGFQELRIVHGKGNGILRDVLRQHLMTYPQVVSAKDEHVERGGAGVTIVTLK